MTTPIGDSSFDYLPSPHQELLLKACLFEGRDAMPFWQAWRANAQIDDTSRDDLDIGSLRLLPLLIDKLPRLGVQDPALRRYRGLERRSWVHNHVLCRAAAATFDRLKAERIPAMALKGIVLASSYYGAMSLRPMDDFDLLVRPRDGLHTLEMLEALGWRVMPDQFRPRAQIDFAVRAATALQHPSNSLIQIDLHWRLFWARANAEAERALWQRAMPLRIDQTECLAPCAADMLIHVCGHGAMWNDIPPVRWVVDAAYLIRSGAVDWDYLCAQTQRLGLNQALVSTLHYLRTAMRITVPDIVLQSLTKPKTKQIDRLLYEARLRPAEQWGIITAFRLHSHVAWHEAMRAHNPVIYARYFAALLRGRGLRGVALWIRERLFGGRSVKPAKRLSTLAL